MEFLFVACSEWLLCLLLNVDVKKSRELKLYARQDSVKYLIVPTTFYAISSTSYSRYCIYTQIDVHIYTRWAELSGHLPNEFIVQAFLRFILDFFWTGFFGILVRYGMLFGWTLRFENYSWTGKFLLMGHVTKLNFEAYCPSLWSLKQH